MFLDAAEALAAAQAGIFLCAHRPTSKEIVTQESLAARYKQQRKDSARKRQVALKQAAAAEKGEKEEAGKPGRAASPSRGWRSPAGRTTAAKVAQRSFGC